KTQLIKLTQDDIEGYHLGDRSLYRTLFRPLVTPDFMFTRVMAQPPLDAEEIDAYTVEDNEVNIFRKRNEVSKLYHLNPPEFRLDEDKYELLQLARNVLAEYRPKEKEFLEPEKMRRTFSNIGRDLLQELAQNKGIELTYAELEQLTNILVRYTVGFGLIEALLQDEKIQDITVNSPVGQSPLFIVHQDHDECYTNILPSREDGESWATKFRLLSGRPLDEANPVLDTELSVPGARARVAILSNPLSPSGVAFALRRQRDHPWTLPLFIQRKMLTPLAAGLLSFLVDGGRSLLVAGSRSAGKTSLMSSLIVELMRKTRCIGVEDTQEIPVDAFRKMGYNIQNMKVRSALTSASSELAAEEGVRASLRMGDSALIVGEVRSSIRGNEKVLIIEEGITKKIPIKDIEEKDISKIQVPTIDRDLKFKIKNLVAFVKHPKRNKLLKVTTKTGRTITVTPDHSIFTTKDFKIIPIECLSLKVNEKIIIPEKLPIGYNDVPFLNLFDLLDDEDCRIVNYEEDLRLIIKKIGWKKATAISDATNDVYQYLRKGIQHSNISISSFKKLAQEANHPVNLQSFQIQKCSSKNLNALFPVTPDFCRFLGYYASEGYTKENGTIVFSNGDPAIIEDIISLSRNLFNVEPFVRKTYSLGESTQITLSNKILGLLLKKLGCGRIATEKKVPSFIFGLSEDKICEFLKGYFDGDGSQTSNEGTCNVIACSTVSKDLADDIAYLLLGLGIVVCIYNYPPRGLGKHQKYDLKFKQRKYVELFLQKVGFKKYNKSIIKRNASHSTFNTVAYDVPILEKHVKLKRKYRHLRRNNSCGKEYLKNVVHESLYASDLIKTFVNGEFFIDEVKKIEEVNLDEGEYVYDLSVEPCQNFIGGFGGILLHNTEAKSLYEAMRIGALANVVMGTIHGADPYSVFDRVVNDLGVPRTSFKATDVIVVVNPIKSADGLKKMKRLVQISEVRKTWEKDPLREAGFLDLMKYNATYDELQATNDLLNGDSEILKSIASNVPEWAGNWDAVWENILLRSQIKKTLVDFADISKDFHILEADFVVQSNDAFHRISDSVQEETGSLDSKRIFLEWESWLKKAMKLRTA
ncbi:MAG: ATPase, T2SS/T4P/T4SS family, partial [Nanoarchaeota archaeon]